MIKKSLLLLLLILSWWFVVDGQILKIPSKETPAPASVPKKTETVPQKRVYKPAPQKRQLQEENTYQQPATTTYTINVESIFNRAIEKYEREDYLGSIELLERIPAGSHSFKTMELKAYTYKNLKINQTALSVFEQIINEGFSASIQEQANIYFEIASGYSLILNDAIDQNQKDSYQSKILSALSNAINLDPINKDYHLMKAKLLFDRNEWTAALDAFNVTDKLLTDNEKGEMFFKRGLIHLKLKNFNQAFDDHTNAKRLGFKTSESDKLLAENPTTIARYGVTLYNTAETTAQYDIAYAELKKAYLAGETKYSPFHIGELFYHNLITVAKENNQDDRLSIAYNYFDDDIKNKDCYSKSFFHLGYMHEKGIGAGKDLEKAKQLYQKGCTLGRKEACDSLEKLK